jgi:hypothetical protein
LLVEPQRTNLLTYSQNFAHASWDATATTINATAGISPDGTLNANKFIPNTSATAHYIDKFYISTLSGSISIYAKADGYNNITILTATFNANFNLSNGTISATGGIGTADIISVGNGWYRCIVYKTLASETVYISCGSNTNAGFFNGSGNGTSGVLIWGAQVEQGAYPTSYIPTTSASVTRNRDEIIKTGISSLIGQSEGTLFYEGSKIGTDDSEFYLSDGTYNNFVRFQYYQNSNIIFVVIYVGGTTQGFLTTSAYNVSDYLKVAIKYKANDFALWINGTEAATDTSGTTFAANTLNSLRFAFPDGNSGNFAANVKSVALWKTALNDDQLELLTGDSFYTYAEMASYYNYTLQ